MATSPATSPFASQPLQIAANCWMVGHRNPASLLQCNTYLRIFDEASRPYRVCIDPGSQLDYPVIEANLRQLTDGTQNIDAISVNHQDPDVIGNAPAFCEKNPRVDLILSQDTWRLAQHLALHPGRVQFSDEQKSPLMSLGSQGRWQVVPTPFCHFRGATAFYDPEIRTIFTGDLFGGLNQLGRVHLFAEPADWSGIAQFHQIYMPSREVLRYAVRQIRSLSPAVEVIAPQHGHVIVGDRIPDFLDRMEQLLVGIDLIACEIDDHFTDRYIAVMRQLLDWSQEMMGNSEVSARLTSSEFAEILAPYVRCSNDTVDVIDGGYTALSRLFYALSYGETAEYANQCRSLVLALCAGNNLPVPPIGVGVEGANTTLRDNVS